MKSPFAFGCQTNLMLDDFPSLQVTLKRSCFRVNDSSSASVFDLLKILSPRIKPIDKMVAANNHVPYENGVLKTEWATS